MICTSAFIQKFFVCLFFTSVQLFMKVMIMKYEFLLLVWSIMFLWIISICPDMQTMPRLDWVLKLISTVWRTLTIQEETLVMLLTGLPSVMISVINLSHLITAYSSAHLTTITTGTVGTVHSRTAQAGGWTSVTLLIWMENITKVTWHDGVM